MNLPANELQERINLFMARKTATKALKFINTRKASNWDAYEITGDL